MECLSSQISLAEIQTRHPSHKLRFISDFDRNASQRVKRKMSGQPSKSAITQGYVYTDVDLTRRQEVGDALVEFADLLGDVAEGCRWHRWLHLPLLPSGGQKYTY